MAKRHIGNFSHVCGTRGAHIFLLLTGNGQRWSARGDSNCRPGSDSCPDLSPPTFLDSPPNIIVESPKGDDVTVAFPLPRASDSVDPNPSIVCSPSSGSIFRLGDTIVTCTATDAAMHSSSLPFTVTVQDTTPPTVQDVRLVTGKRGITTVFLTFSEGLRTASDVDPTRSSNYAVAQAGRDKRFGTQDDKQLGLEAAEYDEAALTVRLNANPRRPLRLNMLLQITAKAEGLTDKAGNLLAGNAGAGTDYSKILGRGMRLSYVDRTGDNVTLRLSRGGVMELVLGGDGEARELELVNTVTNQSTLSGTVRKPRSGGDGRTTLRSISGMSSVINRLPTCSESRATACFDVESIEPPVVDFLLESKML